MRLVPPAVLILLAVAPFAAQPAFAQVDSREGIALQNQILELRRDVQALRDQIARGGSGSGSSSLGGARAPVPGGASDITAALLDRVARLEDDVRTLRGRVDEADNARQRMSDDLSKQIADLSFRLDNGGGARPPGSPPAAPAPLGPPPSSFTMSPPPAPLGATVATPAAPATQAPAPPVRRTPEVALQESSAALARRDYPAAEAAAREVLAVPKSPRAIEAQFLLAQALMGKKDFTGAAVAYDDTYNRARTGAHAEDSLLGLANALSSIGEKRSACATLDKLRAEFPQLRPDLRDPTNAARQRAGCR
jgi:TolA-binding protein